MCVVHAEKGFYVMENDIKNLLWILSRDRTSFLFVFLTWSEDFGITAILWRIVDLMCSWHMDKNKTKQKDRMVCIHIHYVEYAYYMQIFIYSPSCCFKTLWLLCGTQIHINTSFPFNNTLWPQLLISVKASKNVGLPYDLTLYYDRFVWRTGWNLSHYWSFNP